MLLSVTAQPKAHSPLIGASLRDTEGLGGGLLIAGRACLYLNFGVFAVPGKLQRKSQRMEINSIKLGMS